MCHNSPQNILDRLRHVSTLPIVTKSSECAPRSPVCWSCSRTKGNRGSYSCYLHIITQVWRRLVRPSFHPMCSTTDRTQQKTLTLTRTQRRAAGASGSNPTTLRVSRGDVFREWSKVEIEGPPPRSVCHHRPACFP